MSKCKCQNRARIVSDVVQSMGQNGCRCKDVCVSPICADPSMLGIMAPLIYDEIGINLCATFPLGTALPTTNPTATSAKARVVNATYTYGAGNVQIERIASRSNCYAITLSNITLQFAVDLFDSNCRLLTTLYPTAVYLPPETTAATYDENTNPTSVELEIFAPYGSGVTVGDTTTPNINYVGYGTGANTVTQGINLFAYSKALDLDTDVSTITVGVTLVLQSLYYAGYKVQSAGKIAIPKGSIVNPEDSACMKFVAGELLNLAIKPLDLGAPNYEEFDKCEAPTNNCNDCPVVCDNCYQTGVACPLMNTNSDTNNLENNTNLN